MHSLILKMHIEIITIKSVLKLMLLYYGGTICGVCSIFSAVTKVAGMEVKTIFTSKDLPAYHAYEPNKCPMCEAGDRVEAIVNSFGYSKL